MKRMISICLTLLTLLSIAGSACGETNKETITIATSQEPVRFFSCGPEGSNSSDYIVLYNIYDTLVQLTPEGKIVPSLATSWDISEDGLDYTFHLRDDVTFHNGERMTADDVAYTFDYNIGTAIGKALLINYTATDVIDDTTLVVHLSSPFAAFLNGLAARAGQIISKKYMEANGVEGYLSNPIGTGPYKLKSRTSGDTITLEAYDAYWGGEPAIKTVLIKTMTDVSTQIIALEAKKY